MKLVIRILPLLFALFVAANCTASQKEDIPLSIDHVETYRVADSLVRVIAYNTELLPRITIELIQTPDVKLLQKLVIEKITIGKEELAFKKSTSVSIDNITVENGVVNFSVEYYFSGGRPFITAACQVDANNNKLSPLTCHQVNP